MKIRILILLTILFLHPSTVYAQSRPNQPDIDITYIERTPRYYKYCVEYPNDLPTLCPGTENQKRWPNPLEPLTYTAHIKNKGLLQSSPFTYEWQIDGQTHQIGEYTQGITFDQEITLGTIINFPGINQPPQTISLHINPIPNEITTNNNSYTIGSHDLTISYWVEAGYYDALNNILNARGSYSFEDWINIHFQQFNQRIDNSPYSGVTPPSDRIRIDKIVIAPELDGPNSPMNTDPHRDLIDGRWQFRDNDPTNQFGTNGFYQNYANTYRTMIDWGLIHEIAHQLGLIDLYHFRLPIDPPNNGIQIKNINGALVTRQDLPNLGETMPYYGIMGGGDIRPNTDHTLFSKHTQYALYTNRLQRRGFYGEYLYDVPDTTSLRIHDKNGLPLTNAQITLHQRQLGSEVFPEIPVITGTTNSEGIIQLPNRNAPTHTTATGHTLKPNPFGKIHVVAANGTMIMTVTKNNQQGYGFLLLHDLNIAEWENRNTIDITTTYPQITYDPGPITPTPIPRMTPGDANNDNTVNILDYQILSNTFSSTSDLRADFNNDSVINILDYQILANNF